MVDDGKREEKPQSPPDPDVRLTPDEASDYRKFLEAEKLAASRGISTDDTRW